MDPALKELIRSGNPEERVEAIIRQDPRMKVLPPQVDVMAEFSEIKTIRVKRRDIEAVWAHPGTASVKAARVLQFEDRQILPRSGEFFKDEPIAEQRHSFGNKGRGIVVGVVDWGFDFAHPAFLDAQKNSRIDAIWDQRGKRNHRSPRFGYGRVLSRKDIDAALATKTPYKKLGYHPGDADTGIGAHGTHVADIAAGSVRKDGGGMAPEASLAFVHLASHPLSGLADLGDSVRLLEAIKFLDEIAGDRPLVINLSVGRHGGAHMGLTLVEQAFDRFLESKPDRLIVQSAGNYYKSNTHAQGHLAPGKTRELKWQINRGDRTSNELEIWYSDRDNFQIEVTPPGGTKSFKVKRGDSRGLYNANGKEIGRIYHRAYDPNSPDHHFQAFLKPNAPSGIWKIKLTGYQIQDGRYHAWIERDGRGKRQSKFIQNDVNPKSTIGSICNGFLPISVGAADIGPFGSRPAPFASAGPTRDGRQKPDLSAPGMRITAARSTPKWASHARHGTTRMSGASQASPYVAGYAAALMSSNARVKDIHSIRSDIFKHVSPVSKDHRPRLGAGLLNKTRQASRSSKRFQKTLF